MYRQILIAAMAVSPLTASFAWQGEPHPMSDGTGGDAKVRVLSAAQMSEGDAAVLEAHREAIASAAEVNGYDLGTGSWIRNQVVCPDAPRHVLMHYLKINQDGSLSLFTAAVPRSGGTANLRVRIIPVLYHGAPAFHVFGSLPAQRDLINEVVSAQQFAKPVKNDLDWTPLAYCYAALAGAEPTAKSVTAPEETTPLLVVSQERELREMLFSVVGPEHVAQNWRIVFDRQAKVTGIILSAKPVNDVQKVVPGGAPPVGAPPSAGTVASPGTQASPGTPHSKQKEIPQGTVPPERPIPAQPLQEKPIPQPQ